MNNEEWLKQVNEAQEAHINKLTELMERSEARIDRTNEMVCLLATTVSESHKIVDKLTHEYTKHLADLSQCRNTLLEQNKTLLRLHENDLEDKRTMRAEITESRDRIFNMLDKIYTTSRGVKIENNFDDR